MRRNIVAALGSLPVILCLLFASLTDQAWGQLRVYGKVDPNTGDPEVKLNFDVNTSTSDNVAPNIVFSSGGSRGYVAYAGSGAVLGFSTATGTILARITTGGKPSAATPLPDGHTIAYVSAMGNQVFLVDIETDTVVATYTFEGAEFGFGSVVAVSPDGSTGYISSTGTGEVIKFAMADGHELARLGGFSAPCRIAVSIDGSILMVVDTIKETLVFVNAASLTIKSTLVGPSGTSINYTIVTQPVLSKDGSTGIIASRATQTVFGSDTVILFRTSTGELISTALVGAQPLFAGLTPDGSYWIVLCTDSLWKIPTASFDSLSELQTVGTQAVDGSNVSFSPDSRYVYYTASSDDTLYQHDILSNIIVGKTGVGNPGDKGTDQPSSVGVTPDGKSVAVVDFAINVLDLVEPTSYVASATFVSSSSRFTGVSLVNVAPVTNKATITALDVYGQVITGTGVTNPVDYILDPNDQVSLTVGEIFHFDPANEKNGWLSILTSSPDTVGYYTIGDTNLSRLDAAPLFSKPLTEWIVPDIAKGTGISTELDIVNPDYMQTTYDATRYNPDGSSAEKKTGLIAYPTNRTNQTVATVFPSMSDGTAGYLRIKTAGNLFNTALTQTDSALAALNGIQISDFAGIKKIYSPHFVVGYGYKTILNLINAGSGSADITITLHSPDGATIGLPYHTTLAVNAQLKSDLATIFKGDSAVSNVTGWLEVQSSQDKVVGDISFSNSSGRFATTFQLLGVPWKDFIFPVLALTDVYQTGIALMNTSAEQATVTVEVWGVDGTMKASTAVTLGPYAQQAEYLNNYFPNLGQMLKGNIRIHSTANLFGLALIHDKGLTFMTAIPSFPLP